MACHIPLEKIWRVLQFCFRPHLNWRFAHKVICLHYCKSLNFEISGLQLGSIRTKWHLGVSLMVKHREYYKGKVVASPSSSYGESCEFVFAHGSSVHQKCFDYALTNLLFSLCRSVWIIESLVACPSHVLKLQHAPLPPKCYEPKSTPQLLFLTLFSTLDL
jgi:hypothetical protein